MQILLAGPGLRRYDNGSDGSYGKIIFNVDESKYYVEKVEVRHHNKSDGENETGSTLDATYNPYNDKAISVNFSKNAANHYFIKAYMKEKTSLCPTMPMAEPEPYL